MQREDAGDNATGADPAPDAADPVDGLDAFLRELAELVDRASDLAAEAGRLDAPEATRIVRLADEVHAGAARVQASVLEAVERTRPAGSLSAKEAGPGRTEAETTAVGPQPERFTLRPVEEVMAERGDELSRLLMEWLGIYREWIYMVEPAMRVATTKNMPPEREHRLWELTADLLDRFAKRRDVGRALGVGVQVLGLAADAIRDELAGKDIVPGQAAAPNALAPSQLRAIDRAVAVHRLAHVEGLIPGKRRVATIICQSYHISRDNLELWLKRDPGPVLDDVREIALQWKALSNTAEGIHFYMGLWLERQAQDYFRLSARLQNSEG